MGRESIDSGRALQTLDRFNRLHHVGGIVLGHRRLTGGATILSFPQELPIRRNKVLQRLTEILAAFDADPRMAEKAIRELLASDEKQFFAASLTLLKSGTELAGREWLAALLAGRDLLAGPLCDPSFCSCEEAIAMARLAARRQPQLDIKLARKLAELEPAAAERALAILDAVSDGSRIISMLMPLMRHSNSRLRSKSAYLIGRSIKRCDWAAGYLSHPDPRTRGNAVEALWGFDLPEAKLLFRKAASDPHGRVAVNAIIGLYRLGEPSAIVSLCELALRDDPKIRASAAWGMGELGDARFLMPLERMKREPESVGRNISRAIGRIETASSQVKQRGLLHLCVTDAQSLADGTRRLRASIAAGDRWDPILLAPTCFVISENSAAVTSYRVQAVDSITPLLMGFVLCGDQHLSDDDLGSAKTAVLGCLEHKRVSDSWSVALDLEQILPFTTDGAMVKRSLNGSSAEATRKAVSQNVFSTLAERASRLRGNRHVILLAGQGGLPAGAFAAQQPPLDQILKPLLDANIAVHAIGLRAASPPEALAAMCRRTGGVFAPAGDTKELAEVYQRLYSSIRNRYEILYRADAPASEAQVRVEVYSEFGYGQAETRLG